MAKAKKKAAKKEAPKLNGKEAQKQAEPKPKAEKKTAPPPDLEPLKKDVLQAQAARDKAKAEAEKLRQQAKEVERVAKEAYAKTLAPYRAACRKAGVKCEFIGGKAGPVAPRVRFLVERVDKGIKVAIKDRPETETVIPDAVLKKSVGKAALAYCERHLGPVETQGAKHAGLGNRLRNVLRGK